LSPASAASIFATSIFCIVIIASKAGGDEARRAFEAMMTMQKIDVAAIDKARRG